MDGQVVIYTWMIILYIATAVFTSGAGLFVGAMVTELADEEGKGMVIGVGLTLLFLGLLGIIVGLGIPV